MGKVYDALRRAEREREQRARAAMPDAAASVGSELSEVSATSAAAAASDESQGLGPARKKRRFWQRRGPKEASARARARGGRAARQDAALEVATAHKRRISLMQPDSFVADQFRTLRGRIDTLATRQPLRSIAVTSALPGEGKTTSAVNLAVVTAMGVGRRVLLMDCDLRNPSIHQALGVQGEAGLAEVLLDRTSLDTAIVKLEGPNLDVLAVRALPPNPSELLASTRMHELLEELVQRYDRIILDVPPTLGVPDAKIVTELCDGVVLVVRADLTPRGDVEHALDVLDRRRILGLVLNGARVDEERYEYGR